MRNLIAMGYMNSDSYSFQAHKHDCWEISYYIKGEGTNTIGDQVFHFKPGDIICQPPHINHSELAAKGYRNIFFSVRDLDCMPGTVPCFKDNEAKVIYSILMQLNTEHHLQRSNWKNICEALLNAAYQFMLSFASPNHKTGNKYIEMMESQLIANLSTPNFCIEHIFNNVPISKDYARRLFTAATGKTPSEYLTEKRIYFAKQLIISYSGHCDISLKKIAHQSGFEDPYYFSRVFKKITGKCPTDWIKSS
jgi:AraC-like DNA-binding protein